MAVTLAVISILIATSLGCRCIRKKDHKVVPIRTPSDRNGEKRERGVGPNQ